jgi:hypothetical protein
MTSLQEYWSELLRNVADGYQQECDALSAYKIKTTSDTVTLHVVPSGDSMGDSITVCPKSREIRLSSHTAQSYSLTDHRELLEDRIRQFIAVALS